MQKQFSLQIGKYSLEDINEGQFSRLRLWIVKDGQNAHKMPISLETIKNAAFSLIGKPVVFKYSIRNKDFEGHEEDEVPCGVFMQDCNISYEQDEEDSELTWLVADCIIWKYYCPEVIEVFQRDGDKSISMEIQILETKLLEDNTEEITSFLFMAVTLLGSQYIPAISNAKATVLKFSEMVEETEKLLNQKSTDFSLENKEDDVNINSKKKEDELMVFNKEEFAKTFSMTANELWEMLSNACNDKKYMDGDYEYSVYWMRDYDDTYIYAYNYQDNKLQALPYSMKDGACMVDFDNAKNAKLTYVVTDDDAEDMMKFAEKILEKKMSCKEKEFSTEKEQLNIEINSYKEQVVTFETEKNSMTEKINTLENEKVEFSNKITSLEKENGELKEFKTNVEKQEEDSKIDFAIQAVSEDLSAEQIEEWRGKTKDFSNIDDFANALKAFAFDVASAKKNPNKKDFNRIHIPQHNEEKNESKSVWDRLNKQNSN